MTRDMNGALKLPEKIAIGLADFRPIEHPKYAEAHPDDPPPLDPDVVCEFCLWAERIGTGERVLLWNVGLFNWSISRHDPNHDRLRAELLL